MAINEQIVTGRAHRVLIDKVAKLWQRISFWTKASDVEFNDGKTAETKVGMINGITSDLNCEDESIAISASAIQDLLNAKIAYWIDNGYLPDPDNPIVKLYDYGDQCTNITGGWTGSGTGYSMGGNYLRVSTSTGNNQSIFTNNKLIDLTGKTKLTIIFNRTSSGNYKNSMTFQVRIENDIVYTTSSNFSSATEIEVDISNYSGKHFVKFYAYSGGESGLSGFPSQTNIYFVSVQ